MSHAGEGLLQAYIDGEVRSEAEAELIAHLDACGACAAELQAMRGASALFNSAMSVMTAAPAMVTAREQVLRIHRTKPAQVLPVSGAGFGRFAAGGLARAAALTLLVTGAAAAIIPGSPLRRWLTGSVGSADSANSTEVEAPVVTPATPSTTARRAMVPGAELVIAPANGSVRVSVDATAGDGRVTVRFVDAARATVQTDSSAHAVTFRNAAGRVDVLNLGTSDAEITMPRSLRTATVVINGRTVLVKDGSQLRVTGPTVANTADLIVFRTGS